jgi:PadR family transcriptional regulator, regulatory protein AphA
VTASTPNLTPTSFVVLGLLDAFGPSTSYELERAAGGSIGAFWTFPRSQLYSEPARLAGFGLVDEEQESSGRRRRTYRLRAAGRRALQQWLAEPSLAGTEIRDLGLLKLFFAGAAASPAHIAASARASATAHRRALAVYEELASHEGMEPHQHATLRLGLTYERAAVAFWDEVARDAGDERSRPRRLPSPQTGPT